MKKAIFPLLIGLFALGPLMAADPVFSSYPKEMKGVLDTISELPEARPLLQAVARDGKVSVSGSNNRASQFPAFWDGGNRQISVTNAAKRSRGSVIQSVVFELHNAKRTPELIALDNKAIRGQISRDEYVEGLERMEHRNVVEAQAVLNAGIRRGLFPADAKWNMPTDFDEYFRMQKQAGHSGWIAQKYDRMQPLAHS